MDFVLKTMMINGHKTGPFSVILVEQVSLGTMLLYPASVTESKTTGSRTCLRCFSLQIWIQQVLTVACSTSFQNCAVDNREHLSRCVYYFG